MTIANYLRRLMKACGYLAVTGIILFGLFVMAGRLLTPIFNRHLPDFNVFASQIFNSPITIQRVHLSWSHYRPALTFEQVEVLDKETHQTLIDIQEIKIHFNVFKSLLKWKPELSSVKILGANLALHEAKTGQLALADIINLPVIGSKSGSFIQNQKILSWIFAQPKLSLYQINVQLISPVGLEQAVRINNLTLRNSGQSHALQGSVTLLQEEPTDVALKMDWRGKVEALTAASANIYLSLQSVDLSQWLKKQSWHHWRVTKGMGSVKLWANWKSGAWQNIQTQFEMDDVLLVSDAVSKTKSLSRLSGELGWRQENGKYVIQGQDILIDLPNHLWPTMDFMLTVSLNPTNNAWQVNELSANYVNLGDTREWLQDFQLFSPMMNQWTNELQPQGDLKNVSLQLSDEVMDWNHLVIAADLKEISLNAIGEYPALHNLTGHLEWDGKEGKLSLNSDRLIVAYPKWYEHGVLMGQASGDLTLTQNETAHTWDLSMSHLKIVNPTINIKADIKLHQGENETPSIDLAAQYSVSNLKYLIDYLPVKILDVDLVKWLKSAFLSGQVDSGNIIMKGKLSDFPFQNNNGTLSVDAKVKNAEINYASPWPTIHDLNGQLSFTGKTITIDTETGFIYQIPLGRVHATISNVGVLDPTLLTVQGLIHSDLEKCVYFIHYSPLDDTVGGRIDDIDLFGPITLNLGLTVPLAHPTAVKVLGDVTLANARLSVPDLKMTVDQLNGGFHFTESDIAAKNIQGQFFKEPMTLSFSTLRLNKNQKIVRAQVASQLKIAVLQDWLKIPVTKILKGESAYKAQIDFPTETNAASTVVTVDSDLKGISVDIPAPYGKASDSTRPFQLVLSMKDASPATSQINYGDLKLQIGKLSTGWQVGVTNPMMSGQVILPDNKGLPIQANFQSLFISPSSVAAHSGFNPKDIPALSFVGQEVRYGDKKLGRVAMEISPSVAGIAIKNITVNSDVVNLTARGSWESVDNGTRTYIQGTMQTNRLTTLLSQWGTNVSNLVATKGSSDFNLGWADAPYNPTLKSLSGSLSINVGSGRIINLGGTSAAKLDIGRMLNILNLDSIPRRLSLDFSDLFQNGYAFDYIKGTFTFTNGNAYTQNMQLKGPVAEVNIAGRMGLSARNYDLSMNVTPYVTSSLPVVATIAGGPLAGMAAWVVDKVVSKAVSKVTTYHYKVTGSWDNPVWVKQ